MEITAKYLAHALEGEASEKVVVLTGAMRPWCVGRSDAGFNLDGRVFAARDLRKDTKSGRFD